ncbi:MAG: hypothetical protein IRZ28_20815 [Steroidobacteraceae bacterium]|nr:hypothetical protein [Steroidobacteraceae bacterium]
MPLIDSPRLTDADRQVWARYEHYDTALAQDPHLDRLADRARKEIRQFAAAGPCFAAISWGRDSTVVAFLVATADVDIPLVWAVADRGENPDSPAVRDAFLDAFPHVSYHEVLYVRRSPLRGESHPPLTGPGVGMSETLAARYGSRRITGVRAAESGQRRISAAVHGLATDVSCRPILRWSHQQVFAALTRWDLPIHPAYAMTCGGAFERDSLQVHSIGGRSGDPQQRARWEQAYYPDVIAAALEAGPRTPMTSLEDRVLAVLATSASRRRWASVVAADVGAPLAEVQAVLDRLEREGRVLSRSRAGQTRYWRTASAPSEPASEPAAERLF